MQQHLKFLSLAVKMGKITEQDRKRIIDNQRRRKLLGEHIRVGQLAIQLQLLTETGRDDVLRQQESLERQIFLEQRARVSQRTSNRGWQVGVLVAAVAMVVVVYAKYRQLELTIAIVGFLTYVVETVLQYKAGRSFMVALQRAAFPLLTLAVVSLVVFAAVSVLNIKHDPSHLVSGAHAEEEKRIRTILIAFSAMGTAISILFIYSLWKFYSLRFSQSRLGALKDILIRVEKILHDRARPLSERKNDANKVVLRGLRNAIRLSPADRLMRVISVFRPSFNQSRVLYFVPQAATGVFRVFDAAYPEKVSDEVLEAFQWLKEHHHPVRLDEAEFERLKALAKTFNPQDWKKAFLSRPERHEYVSVCGWVFDKQEILFSADASKCLAFDDSFLSEMKDEGFDANVLQWVEVGSFVGCRIVGEDGEPAGVLLVIKNVRKGFPPEDLEVVITASQILGRILQAT